MGGTIPLAKGYAPGKLKFPVYVSEKLDGVPVRIDIDPWGWTAQTRQGEDMPSVRNQVNSLVSRLRMDIPYGSYPVTFVAEVTHEIFTNFKDISGVVRRKEPQDDLILNIFDYFNWNGEFAQRLRNLKEVGPYIESHDVRLVRQHFVGCRDHLDEYLSRPMKEGQEGWIIRSHNAEFKPGTRHWDYQKYVVDPCVDLRITGFEEAVSATGEPLGMIGRIIADFHGQEIGVGPGKLSHDERRTLWMAYEQWRWSRTREAEWPTQIATVKYKRDPSYAALRQPTFQHWRPEKTEPSYD